MPIKYCAGIASFVWKLGCKYQGQRGLNQHSLSMYIHQICFMSAICISKLHQAVNIKRGHTGFLFLLKFNAQFTRAQSSTDSKGKNPPKKGQLIVYVNYKEISCICSQLICSVLPFMFSCLLASGYYFGTSSQETQYCQNHSVFLETSTIPKVFYLRVHKKSEWCLILCTAGKNCPYHVILSPGS